MASCPARGTSLSGPKNCENNPMQSRNGASHYPKTQDLVVRIGASGHEKNAAHLARPPTSSHPALMRSIFRRQAMRPLVIEHAAKITAINPSAADLALEEMFGFVLVRIGVRGNIFSARNLHSSLFNFCVPNVFPSMNRIQKLASRRRRRDDRTLCRACVAAGR
jgi:hypothetical protein